jgi:hypothetical protein
MRARIAIVSLACMLVPGCGAIPVRPVLDPPNVRLSLALSAGDGSPRKPIIATAVARNAGRETVYHYLGCGCDGIALGLLGPDGAWVTLTDPCEPFPLCPCGPAPLAPGTALKRSLWFAGDAYRRPAADDPGGPCVRMDAPPGDYTVVARYGFTWNGKHGLREQRATFHWSGP